MFVEEMCRNIPVQKINVICFQSLEAFCHGHVNVFAIVADFATTIRGHMVAELGGEEYLKG